jgi:DNA helicase-2/ATP-dependent DNA helicase PcrA
VSDLDDLLDQNFEGVQEAPKERIWSDLQTAIFEAGESSQENIIIQAVAGSGKSTTLRELTKHLMGNSTVVAFNKNIQVEMDDMLMKEGSYAKAKTFNALGHRLMMQNRRGAGLKIDKLRDIVRSLMDPSEYKEHGYAVQRAVGLAKNNGFGLGGSIVGIPEFIALFESYDLNIDSKKAEYFAAKAGVAFQRSVDDTTKFDFDDQLWVPLYEGWQFYPVDNLLVDEFQDLTPIQHMMIEKMTEAGSRLIGVGDRHQAIYGFRGAMSDSMDAAKSRFQMRELPLSITYRCPELVVEEAQYYCQDIMAREGAPRGLVERVGDLEGPEKDPDLFNESLVMCRNNAPLFRAILRHVRAKRPCKVLTNFLDSFKSFINGFKCEKTIDLLKKLEIWYETESANAKAKKFWGRLEALTDKFETAKLLAGEFSTVPEVIRLLERLALGTSGPTFATIHKAKGLEHDHAYLLRPDLIPAIYARSEEQLRQEDNLMYVAITRAKQTFTYGETQI